MNTLEVINALVERRVDTTSSDAGRGRWSVDWTAAVVCVGK